MLSLTVFIRWIELIPVGKEKGQCKNLRGNICKNPIFA